MKPAVGSSLWVAGRTIAGRFEIQQEVSAGGSGTVYRGIDIESGEQVAIKRVRAQGDNLPRFAREAQSLARFQHPHVVRYIAHGIDETASPYLVMEWLEGEDLRARLLREPLTVAESVILALRVADALAAVHARGLLHRDIKPGNLFLEDKRPERVKLLDFGLVRGDVEAWSLTRTGTALGTPGYMAPEQARGQRDIDHRADIFSLGCVLYKCLSGKGPFEGANMVSVMTKVLVADPVPLRTERPSVPRALADLVHRMLAKEPSDRPQSAHEVAEALSTLSIEDSAELIAPVSSIRVGSLTARERRLSVVLMVCAALAPLAERPAEEDAPFLVPELEHSSEIEGQMLGLFLIEQGGHMDRLADGTRIITPASPGSATDQAAWAARCALALQAILPAPMAIAMGYREQGGVAPMGDAIERASVMLGEGLSAAEAEAGDSPPSLVWVAIDEATRSLLDSRFDVRHKGPILELVGMAEGAIGPRALLGRLSPILGRDWEISSVTTLFRDCVEGPSASAVMIVGAAGLGKSRLATELMDRIRAESPATEVWTARGDSVRARSSLHLLGRVIHSVVQFHKDDTDDARRSRLRARMAAHLPPEDAERAALILGELAGVSFPDSAHPGLRAARADAMIMADQIRWAWEAFVAAECAAHPVVLVIDDLQWADVPTVRLLDSALRRVEAMPFMLILLGRPEIRSLFPTLSKTFHFQEIRLKPLSPRVSMELLDRALGDASTPEIRARLAARAEGNAFFLEELIHAFGRHYPSEVGDSDTLPETVLATVQARLARFDEETRRLLRAASIFGDVLWAGGVAALLGETDLRSITSRLEALVSQEILLWHPKSRFKGEAELAFRHALLREGASAMLTEEDRALGHRLAGMWLLRAGEQDAAVLARHFEQGGDAARAAPYYAQAARKAVWGMDLDAAADFARHAVAAAEGDEQRTQALTIACEIFLWHFDWAEAVKGSDELLRIARKGSTAWAQALSAKQSSAYVYNRPSDMMMALLTLVQGDPEPEALPRYTVALSVGIYTLAQVGQLGSVDALMARLEATSARAAADDLVVRGWLAIARTYWHLLKHGDPWTALQHADVACVSLTEAGDRRSAAFATVYRALCLHGLGALEAAAHDFASVPVQGTKSIVWVYHSLYSSFLSVDRGLFDEAEALAAERIAIDDPNDPMGPARRAEGHFMRSEISRARADFAAAESELAPVIEDLRKPPLCWQPAVAALARSRLALGRPAEALEAVRPAMESIESQGGEGLRGLFVRVTYAEALAATGQREAAEAALSAAHHRLLTVAARIVDADTRARFLARVEENARLLALVRDGFPR